MNRSAPPRRHGRRRARTTAVAVVVAGLALGGAAAWLSHDRASGPANPSTGAAVVPFATAVTPTGAAPADATPGSSSSTDPAPGPGPSPTPTAVGIDLAQYSTTDPSSPWVVVNKQHPVDPLSYEPSDLVAIAGGRVRSVVAPDLQAMLAAATSDGVRIGVRTAYRSYNFQVSVHADVVRRSGTAYADEYSARPGYSEHQTGLAVDIHSTADPSCDLKACFTTTPEGQWVAAHGWEFGFVVRYTPENSAVTGYSPEAWHLRYVGRELAAWMHAGGVTSLEEVFGVTGGSQYPAD